MRVGRYTPRKLSTHCYIFFRNAGPKSFTIRNESLNNSSTLPELASKIAKTAIPSTDLRCQLYLVLRFPAAATPSTSSGTWPPVLTLVRNPGPCAQTCAKCPYGVPCSGSCAHFGGSNIGFERALVGPCSKENSAGVETFSGNELHELGWKRCMSPSGYKFRLISDANTVDGSTVCRIGACAWFPAPRFLAPRSVKGTCEVVCFMNMELCLRSLVSKGVPLRSTVFNHPLMMSHADLVSSALPTTVSDHLPCPANECCPVEIPPPTKTDLNKAYGYVRGKINKRTYTTPHDSPRRYFSTLSSANTVLVPSTCTALTNIGSLGAGLMPILSE